MKPSDVDSLSDEEAIAAAALVGAQFAKQHGAWYVDTAEYPAHGSDASWHPIEVGRRRRGLTPYFETQGGIARAYVKWALRQTK